MSEGALLVRWRQRRRERRDLLTLMAVQTLNDAGVAATILTVQAVTGGGNGQVTLSMARLEARNCLFSEWQDAGSAPGQPRMNVYKVVHDGRVEMSRLCAKAITRYGALRPTR